MASPNAFPQSPKKTSPTSVDDSKDLNGGQTQKAQQKDAEAGTTSNATVHSDRKAPTDTPNPSNAARESTEGQGSESK